MSTTSPTQRSLAHLRAEGWTVQVVEHFNSFTKRRIDLWGVGDLLAMRSDPPEIKLVQVTSGPNVSSRVDKIREEPRVATWLAAGGTLEVHGWRKAGPRGKRKTWSVRIVPIGPLDIADRSVVSLRP